MYVKRIQITNYGPIERLDITFPFDDEWPKPLVLVGPNGSGKSILLSHIVNGLLEAQQNAYPLSPEVESGKVYKLRSTQYIAPGKKFSFARVDFENGLRIRELQLKKRKRDYESSPVDLLETDAKALWNHTRNMGTGYIDFIGFDDRFRVEEIFTRNCILYFPPDRFEDPAWLNEMNLHSKASHMDLMHVQGHTERKIINYSPLGDNQNWLFGLAYDLSVFKHQYQEHAERLYKTALSVVREVIAREDNIGLGIGPRNNRVVFVMSGDQILIPNIFQLSSGEISLLNLFLSILRDYDLAGSQFTQAENIRGVVVVDEIDLHLHTHHQYEILPKLMKMFPKIQFVVTSHSPLFVLGLKEVFGENGFGLYRLPEGQPLSPEEFSEFDEAYRVFANTQRHLDRMRAAIREAQKPLIFVDGKTDVKYHMKAADLLGFDDLRSAAEFRDGSGSGSLKNIWKGMTKDHVEHKKVIILHDPEENIGFDMRENVYRRKIEKIENHPIQKGVENLFSKDTLKKAIEYQPTFIDKADSHRKTERGVDVTVPETWSINKDEKTNLCDWLCENGTADDFQHFRATLEMLRDVLKEASEEPAE